ncbi:MAG: tRNA pseudouridine(38-40) synthase TruA [Thermomicrobiales bacterium]|nr:tRNA pseudouridine(38-40) synthase TruA [Thermomicrobiales bacterium]
MKLTIAYDGRRFFGSQRQGARRTVQAELERAIGALHEAETQTVFAGRTDQGVHAAGQVVSAADPRPDLDGRTVRKALNVRLPADLAVMRVERCAAGFHARYDAIWREYRYRYWTGPRQPLIDGLVAQRERRLDIGAMSVAAGRLLGTHDFAAFAGGGEGVPWSNRQTAPRGTVRTIYRSSVGLMSPWWGDDTGGSELIEIRVAADGFLPRMVRTIAGALIEIGRGERPIEWMDELVAERDRRLAGKTAPAEGLILWRVGYQGDILPECGPSAQVGQ